MDMKPVGVIVLSLVPLVLGACGGSGESSDAPPVAETFVDGAQGVAREAEPAAPSTSPPTTIVATTTTSMVSAPVEFDPPTAEDLARFLAAVEATLGETDTAGMVFADPEFHLTLGQYFCAEFDAGRTLTEVLTAELLDVAPEDRVDEARLLGGVVGAGVATLCPHHADLI